ncbi:MAG: hypothetical protein Q8R83_00985 [Legionellaceae bacterium]|nr:hypothetical protein [Legionellaceae bacterium]
MTDDKKSKTVFGNTKKYQEVISNDDDPAAWTEEQGEGIPENLEPSEPSKSYNEDNTKIHTSKHQEADLLGLGDMTDEESGSEKDRESPTHDVRAEPEVNRVGSYELGSFDKHRTPVTSKPARVLANFNSREIAELKQVVQNYNVNKFKNINLAKADYKKLELNSDEIKDVIQRLEDSDLKNKGDLIAKIKEAQKTPPVSERFSFLRNWGSSLTGKDVKPGEDKGLLAGNEENSQDNNKPK